VGCVLSHNRVVIDAGHRVVTARMLIDVGANLTL
jgi:hypothetical protein